MRIRQLIDGADRKFFSLEFFPPSKMEQMPAFYEMAEDLGKLGPLFVSVTYGAGGGKQRNTLEVTAELARRGFATMAHLTCVGAEPEAISDFLRSLLANGVDNVLALRGDPPKGGEWDWRKSYFRYASDLVDFIKKNFPQMGIGVAAYPSPHPESATFWEDRKFTAEKLAAGADFAVTQLFFDAREYADLIRGLNQRQITVPVIPGILPIQSLDSLKRVLSLCGANIPGKLFLELEEAQEKGGEKALRECGLKFALAQIKSLLEEGAPGIHIYTLNKSEVCKVLLRESGLA